MKRTIIIAAALLIVSGGVWAQETQAPSPQDMKPAPQDAKDIENAKYTNESIARLSFIEGKTFVQRASDLGYEEGALNMPISEGDRIGTADGRAEIHFGKGNFIRLDAETKLDVLNLPKKDDDVARLRVWSGSVYLVVGTLSKEKGIELHTADSSFYVLDRGVYRVDVRENRDTEIEVFEGLIEVAGEDGSSLLKAGQRLEVSEGRFASKPSSFIAVANDSFDKFNESRNSVTRRQFAKAYLPEELSDYEAELDEYGEWTYLPPYGNVWVPGGVGEDWRPYYNGRWTWLPLSGWTWWPYEPWGWSTFHYGRWHWGFDIGWYWIPMNMWGPAWVNWWWDDFYFGWAPMSYWGYPGVLLGGHYYGHYYGPNYPYGSAALTVIRKDHLKAPGIAANALRGDSLKSLNKMSLTNRSLSLRPAGTKISVQPLDGGRVMLRKDDSRTGLTQDKRGLSGTSSAASPRTIRKPSETGASKGAAGGTAVKPQSVKSPDKGSAKAAPAKGSSPAKGSGTADRKIRKKDGGAATSASASSGYRSPSSVGRNINGYPSSPRITRPASYGDRGAARARTFGGPGRSSYSPRTGTIRSGGSTSSSGRSSARVRSSSGSRSSGGSRGSASRGSSPSRGSSSGSHGSSGGSVRRK
jgi:hypothetical protein